MYPPAVFDKLDKQFAIEVLEMFVYFDASVIEENVLIQTASDLINYALKNKLEAKDALEVNPIYLRKAQPER